ncbi:MAG TPA: signal peptidase I [Nitrososphaeraceae archaeon]|nr:signal peptidase I [Nitrososphaeraceae archaeon]
MVLSNRFKVCLISISCGFVIFSIYYFATSADIQFFVVVSESMRPKLNTGDIVIINPSANQDITFASLKIGDIIAFEEPKQEAQAESKKIVVHRVHKISENLNGDRIVTTKGDANHSPIEFVDFPITKDKFVGKVGHSIPYMGLFLIYVDIVLRIIFPPILYILGAVAAGIFIALKIRKRREVTV